MRSVTPLVDPLDPDSSRDKDKAQAQSEHRRRVEVDDLKWVMSHAQGRRFVARLLAEAGVHRASFNASAGVMSFNEGRRHIGLVILADLLDHTPEAYLKLLKEYAKQ